MSDQGDGGEGGGGGGWLGFILIYGVINLITYNAFGILIIPIPGFRRR